jgi:hypothetical protein
MQAKRTTTFTNSIGCARLPNDEGEEQVDERGDALPRAARLQELHLWEQAGLQA